MQLLTEQFQRRQNFSSWRYSAASVALALVIGAISIVIFDGPRAIVACLLGWTMLAIAISDAQEFIVPDSLSLPAIPAGVLVSGLLLDAQDPDSAILNHALCALAAGAMFYGVRQVGAWLRGHEGLGLGDVKLAAVAGAWTGWEGVTLVILGASLGAMLFVAIERFLRGKHITANTKIPFGAFLAPSIWLVWSLLQLELY